jgi:phosphoglycolate phosphatase-like HAD superfamily hydrolase
VVITDTWLIRVRMIPTTIAIRSVRRRLRRRGWQALNRCPAERSKLSTMSGWRVRWVLFDLNGTLLDPRGIADPLGGGEPNRRLVAGAFRDALMLTMADTLSGGAYRALPDYLRAELERALRAAGRDLGVVDAAMRRTAAMDPFPDAEGAQSLLLGAGLHVGVLTNSTGQGADAAVAAAGCESASRW